MSTASTNIREVLNFVPHRPPMVWVDEILKFDENSGECLLIIKDGAHFMGSEGLRATSCLEFIAQAYGYCSVAYSRRKDPNWKPLKKAFLASFKEATFVEPARMAQIKVGDQIKVAFTGVRNIGPITLFDGHASHNGDILCQSQMKVFCES